MLASCISYDSEDVASERTKNRCFPQSHNSSTPPFQGIPANIRINLILSETIETLGYVRR